MNLIEEKIKAACKAGLIPVVEALIYTETDNNFVICRRIDYAFGQAVDAGQLEIIKYLIEKGWVYPDSSDFILAGAIANRHLNVIKYLIENYKPNINMDISLEIAVEINRIDIVKYLVENGADIHRQKDRILNKAKELCPEIFNKDRIK